MVKRVLITGTSRGIGQALARRYLAADYEVLAPPRRELDLSLVASVRGYLARLAGQEIGVLINNAAENKINRIEALALEDWQRILTTNLTSAFLLMQALAPRMATAGWGRIVNVSSCYAFLSRPGRAAYSASKAGLNGLTRTAALEYGERNVLVNAVCPGFVDTEMTRRNNTEEQIRQLAGQTALGRLATPEEIADSVFFLGSEQNTYITGQLLVIDGGFSCQ